MRCHLHQHRAPALVRAAFTRSFCQWKICVGTPNGPRLRHTDILETSGIIRWFSACKEDHNGIDRKFTILLFWQTTSHHCAYNTQETASRNCLRILLQRGEEENSTKLNSIIIIIVIHHQVHWHNRHRSTVYTTDTRMSLHDFEQKPNNDKLCICRSMANIKMHLCSREKRSSETLIVTCSNQ